MKNRKGNYRGYYWVGKKRSKETRAKIRASLMGHDVSLSSRKKMSKSQTGKTQSSETRRKRRLSMIENIERRTGQVRPGYNPDACRLIDEYGKRYGYHFQHAENGGEFYVRELGYWVDGYDTKKNVVIEVYEPWHNWSKSKNRDKQRMQEIIKQLGCKFIVLNTKE